MDPIISILVSFISAGPHSKGEKKMTILFLSFNFPDAWGTVLREIQTEEEKRVLLKDDRPQCLYLALEKRKSASVGSGPFERTEEKSLFFCDGLLYSPQCFSLRFARGYPMKQYAYVLTHTHIHTHTHTLPCVCKPKNGRASSVSWQ